MILWVLLVLLMLWIALFRYRRRRMYELASKIPCSKDTLPLIGIAHKLSGSTEDIMTNMQKFSYEAMETNGISKGWLCHILFFLVLNPVDLEVILKTCLEKDDLHRFIRSVTGNGGIFAPVSIWRRRRKIVLPAFKPKIVETFVEIFSEQSQIIVKRLANMCGSPSFDIFPFISAYSLDAVCETTMGVKVSSQSNLNSPFLTSLACVLNCVCERMLHLWLQPDWLFKLSPQYVKHQRAIQTLHDFTDEVIRKKRVELQHENQRKFEEVSQYDLCKIQRQTFLDLMIELSGGKKGFTNLELREEILTLTMAGADTSAIVLSFTIKLLAKYPEVQERLYEEIRGVLGDQNRPVTKEDIFNMKYLERVIKESLRLYPPAPFIIRKVETEITLPSGLTIPAGSGIVASIFGCHRDPHYWGPDSEHFDPDRFLPERFNLKHACSFMPFSYGPRNCIGYQYALMSIKTVLATIIQKYKIIGEPEAGPIPNIRVKLDILMKAVDGYKIGLEIRKPNNTNS